MNTIKQRLQNVGDWVAFAALSFSMLVGTEVALVLGYGFLAPPIVSEDTLPHDWTLKGLREAHKEATKDGASLAVAEIAYWHQLAVHLDDPSECAPPREIERNSFSAKTIDYCIDPVETKMDYYAETYSVIFSPSSKSLEWNPLLIAGWCLGGYLLYSVVIYILTGRPRLRPWKPLSTTEEAAK